MKTPLISSTYEFTALHLRWGWNNNFSAVILLSSRSKLSVLSSTLIDFLPFFIFAFSLIWNPMQNAQPIYFRGTYVPSCSHAMMLRECMDDVFAYPLYIKLLLFCLKRGSMIFQTPSILYFTKMIIIREQLPLSMIFSDLKIRYFLRRSEERHKNLTIHLIKILLIAIGLLYIHKKRVKWNRSLHDAYMRKIS